MVISLFDNTIRLYKPFIKQSLRFINFSCNFTINNSTGFKKRVLLYVIL